MNNPVQTPYQGKKRCFGEYDCFNCGKQWKSAQSKANTPQPCSKCQSLVFPTKQSSLDNIYNHLRDRRTDKLTQLQQLAQHSKPFA